MNDFGALVYGVFGRALYLDTNVWSELAKGNLDLRSIRFLLSGSATYLVLGPCQVMELSRCPDLIVGLDALIDQFPVCLAAHSDDSELDGYPTLNVGYAFFQTLHGASPEARQAFRDAFTSGVAVHGWDQEGPQIVAARKTDIDRFRARWPKDARGPWRDHFWWSLDQYLRDMCMDAGHEYRPDKLHDADHYRGRKLHFTLMYRRHYLNPKRWAKSDWLDLLHGLELAYASTAILERGLKGSLTEIRRDLPEIAAPKPYSLSDIRLGRVQAL